MANWDPQLVTPTLVAAHSSLGGAGPVSALSSSSVQPHHSVISIVLFAALAIFLLDKAGFRFSVKGGRG